jgi:hypothetical protein
LYEAGIEEMLKFIVQILTKMWSRVMLIGL